MSKTTKQLAATRKKNETDLKKMLAEKRAALRAFRFGEAGSRTRNVREGRNLRREIAQILTLLTEKAVAEAEK